MVRTIVRRARTAVFRWWCQTGEGIPGNILRIYAVRGAASGERLDVLGRVVQRGWEGKLLLKHGHEVIIGELSKVVGVPK
jgi:hypothetical protein